VSTYLRDKVKRYFDELLESAILAGKKMTMADYYEDRRKTKDDTSSVPLDAEVEKHVIPFHLLEDCDFPLFITYEEFSEMLQKTYGIDAQKSTIKQKFDASDDIYNNDAYGDKEEQFRLNYFEDMSRSSWAHFVDYDLFKKKYWPRFSDSYRKKLDCELVYSEFTIIKVCNYM
jgi:hypothetical protein